MWVRAGCESGSWTDGLDGPLRWAFEKKNDKVEPNVSKVIAVIAGRESGPWTAGRDGLLGWTFETNGTASLRRLFQKSVRADLEGGPWTDARDGPLGWTFETNGIASHADCFRSPSERAVGAGRGRTSVTGRWDGLLKRMAKLPTPIVSEVRQSGPWTDSHDGLLGWTFKTNGTDSWRRLFQKSFRVGRGIACCGLAGNIVGIRSSDFLVGRFSSQKWEILNIIFLNLPVLIVFLNRKSRHAMG